MTKKMRRMLIKMSDSCCHPGTVSVHVPHGMIFAVDSTAEKVKYSVRCCAAAMPSSVW